MNVPSTDDRYQMIGDRLLVFDVRPSDSFTKFRCSVRDRLTGAVVESEKPAVITVVGETILFSCQLFYTIYLFINKNATNLNKMGILRASKCHNSGHILIMA